MNQNLRSLLADAGGPVDVAKACGISTRAVYRWLERGSMPRTEYTGETNHAAAIESASGGKVKADDLLQASLKGRIAA